VKALVAMGEFADRLVAMSMKVGVKVTKASSMDEAVKRAVEFAEPGDIVLLSPGCASQDMFRNYEHRGEEFRKAVRELSSEN
jgi:UDP-N-acetylmuramoylalanine--D-glutamate ligase (EC 6.3.2.9)